MLVQDKHSMLKVKIIKIFVTLMMIIFISQLTSFHRNEVNKMGIPPGWDFVQHYSASILAIRGQASSAYNFDKLSLIESSIAGFKVELFPYFLLWNYPPSFLMLIMPLSLLPYEFALILWLFIFFIAYILVLYRIAPNPLTLWLAIAFPANYWNFLHCQNGFFFGTLLGSGLLLLNRKPLISGVLLGLVSCKPHLAFIIPMALIAGRRWQALVAHVSTILVMCVGSAMLFGFETWQAFLDNSSFVRQILESGAAPGHKSASVFAAARMLAARVNTAYLLQMALAIIVIGVVCYVWWRKKEPEISNPILVLGILLSTPYLLIHDLALLAIPLAYFVWQNYDKNLKLYELIILILAWGLPLYSPIIALLTRVQIAPFILITFMVIIFNRAFNSRLKDDFALSSIPTMIKNITLLK